MYLFDRTGVVCLLRTTRESRELVTVLFDWKCMGRQLRPRHATVDDIRSWQTKENHIWTVS